ncbi:hypothetical protein BGZ50_004343 [Haplosporangium sp. Z 11]|nr:hypothetical protein BGZ50_004343 [Haplosporangium sp. Z 11]
MDGMDDEAVVGLTWPHDAYRPCSNIVGSSSLRNSSGSTAPGGKTRTFWHVLSSDLTNMEIARSSHRYPSYADSLILNPISASVATEDESMDEEEQLLVAALERKRQQKLARQQYRQQQLLERQRQQQILEQQRQQYLMEQEILARRRQAQAQAIAQARYEAEQEAIRQYKKKQIIERQRQQQLEQERYRQQQAALRHLFLQHLQQQEVEEQQRQEQAAKEAAKAKALADAKKQQQFAIQAAAAKDNTEEEEEVELEDALSNILNAIFFPHQQLKRHQSQDQEYPRKRQHQKTMQLKKQQKQKDAEELKAKQEKEQEQKRIEEVKAKQQEAAAPTTQTDSEDEDLIGNYFLTFPDIKSMVEAALGSKVKAPVKESTPAQPKKVEQKEQPKKVEQKEQPKQVEATTSTPSSTHSSPELRAADILKQRQQKANDQKRSVEEKLDELNKVELSLNDLSHELDGILTGTISNKKRILLTEENLIKAMFKIDSVESDGDLSVRKRRKELIKKSQGLLDLVDEFKAREAAALAEIKKAMDETKTADVELSQPSTSDEASKTEPEGELAELETLSDIESLPDATVDAEDAPVDAVAETKAEAEATEPAVAEPDVVETDKSQELELEPELISSADSESSSDEDAHEPEHQDNQVSPASESTAPSSKSIDPLDLIVDAALELARSDALDQDFEMVVVH